MKVIGLTGGIASGKSVISSYLKELGGYIIDADKVARDIVKPHSKAWSEIIKVFGKRVLAADGNINRALLGQIVFNDAKSLQELNEITHPEIDRIIKNQIEKFRNGMIKAPFLVIDAPLLIEFGLNAIVDEVWLVVVASETQVKRIVERDRISEEEAWQRINSQMPLEEKLKYADRIIDNNGSLQETYRQVKDYIDGVIHS